MDDLAALRALTPAPPGWSIDWQAISNSVMRTYVRPMAHTSQDPRYHGEGDVLTHTKLVCEALCGMDAFRQLPERQRQLIFLAALLHDIGKISCTRLDNGRWISPNHAAAGAREARRLLWIVCGLCGTLEAQRFRESVCALIRWHTVPPHAIDDPDGLRRLRTIAAAGELLPDFSLRLLCILAQADALGRLCEDRAQLLEHDQLCAELAMEAGCYDGPYPFPTAFTRFSHLSGRNIPPDTPFYDGTWGPVILLSGLPGTGKDTWIRENCPDTPQVCLDQVRLDMGISPEGRQGAVVDRAREQARAFLRQRQPFVWNATNLSEALRQKQLALFHAYGASVRIVYLETSWEEGLRRNQSRRAAVPEPRIVHMLEILSPPMPAEAREIQWLCV